MRFAANCILTCSGVLRGLSRPSQTSTAPLLQPKHVPGACAPAFTPAFIAVLSRPTGRAWMRTLAWTDILPYQCKRISICVSPWVSVDLANRPVFHLGPAATTVCLPVWSGDPQGEHGEAVTIRVVFNVCDSGLFFLRSESWIEIWKKCWNVGCNASRVRFLRSILVRFFFVVFNLYGVKKIACFRFLWCSFRCVVDWNGRLRSYDRESSQWLCWQILLNVTLFTTLNWCCFMSLFLFSFLFLLCLVVKSSRYLASCIVIMFVWAKPFVLHIVHKVHLLRVVSDVCFFSISLM